MKLYAVFGNPIQHSKSPYLHNTAFYNLGIDARYVRILLDLNTNAEDFREQFFEYGLSGANITIPFKEIALKACDEVSEIAQKIGAINTIVRRGERLFGYNTDAMGFYRNIADYRVKTALVIGAGGSAKAIAFILQERGIGVSVINRSENRLEFFRQNGFKSATFGEFSANLKGESGVKQARNFSANLGGESQYDLIVNATSSSINGELPLDRAILAGLFSGAKIAFDLMYGKKCPFLELAKKCGGIRGKKRGIRTIQTIDGANMLRYQAIEAQSLFLNKPYAIIEKAMTKV